MWFSLDPCEVICFLICCLEQDSFARQLGYTARRGITFLCNILYSVPYAWGCTKLEAKLKEPLTFPPETYEDKTAGCIPVVRKVVRLSCAPIRTGITITTRPYGGNNGNSTYNRCHQGSQASISRQWWHLYRLWFLQGEGNGDDPSCWDVWETDPWHCFCPTWSTECISNQLLLRVWEIPLHFCISVRLGLFVHLVSCFST